MTLVLVGAFRLARVIHPHQIEGPLIHSKDLVKREQLVSSTGIASLLEHVDGTIKVGRAEGEILNVASWQYWTKPIKRNMRPTKQGFSYGPRIEKAADEVNLALSPLSLSPRVFELRLSNCRSHCRKRK